MLTRLLPVLELKSIDAVAPEMDCADLPALTNVLGTASRSSVAAPQLWASQPTHRYYSKAVWGAKAQMHPFSTRHHLLTVSTLAFSGRNHVIAERAYSNLHSSVPFCLNVSLMSKKSVSCTFTVSSSQATSYMSFVCIPVTVAGNLLCRVPND